MVQTRSAAKNAGLVGVRALDHTESTHEEDAVGASADGNSNTTSTAQQRSRRVKARKDGPQTQGIPKRQYMRGKLAMLLEMNLDVLSQILSYLHPMDLLNLARLSRVFRQFLMSKAHAFVWVAARKHVDGLPDCPFDMSEPEYANLAFDKHCHSCGRVVHLIYWHIRRRYCPACRVAKLRVAEGCDGIPDALSMLPSEHLTGIIELRGGASFVDKQQYDTVYKEYLKTPIGRRPEFIAQRSDLVAKRKKQAKKCLRWQSAVSYAHKEKLEDARKARKASIFARLKIAGYAREIGFVEEYLITSCYPEAFRTSRNLTETELNEICTKLEPSMIEFRAERLETKVFRPRRQILTRAYNQYIQHPAPEGGVVDILPAVWDVIGFPPFDAIIHLPEDQIVEEMTFTPILVQIPALARQWREKVDAQLASIVDIGLGRSRPRSTHNQKRQDASGRSPKERLHLACAVFEIQCGPAHELFNYASALLGSLNFYEPYGRMWIWPRESRPWSLPEGIHLFSGALCVVAACGLDSCSATVDDMDQRNARLICNECRERSPDDVKIYDWKLAIQHAFDRHRDTAGLSERWALLDEHLIPDVEARESLSPRQPPPVVHCALCQRHALPTKFKLENDSDKTDTYRFPPLLEHLSDAHGMKAIEGPLQKNVHYIVPDSLASRRPVRMITCAEGGRVSFSHE